MASGDDQEEVWLSLMTKRMRSRLGNQYRGLKEGEEEEQKVEKKKKRLWAR